MRCLGVSLVSGYRTIGLLEGRGDVDVRLYGLSVDSERMRSDSKLVHRGRCAVSHRRVSPGPVRQAAAAQEEAKRLRGMRTCNNKGGSSKSSR